LGGVSKRRAQSELGPCPSSYYVPKGRGQQTGTSLTHRIAQSKSPEWHRRSPKTQSEASNARIKSGNNMPEKSINLGKDRRSSGKGKKRRKIVPQPRSNFKKTGNSRVTQGGISNLRESQGGGGTRTGFQHAKASKEAKTTDKRKKQKGH